MTLRVALLLILAALLLGLPACRNHHRGHLRHDPSLPHWYWGSYEASLYERHRIPGHEGRAAALTMVETTIQEAVASERPVPPGVYADYGYLLFKEGRGDESIRALKKEAGLYPESQHLMETMISRIRERQ